MAQLGIKTEAHQALRVICQVADFGPKASSRTASQTLQACSHIDRKINHAPVDYANYFDCVAALFCLEGYIAIPIRCVLP